MLCATWSTRSSPSRCQGSTRATCPSPSARTSRPSPTPRAGEFFSSLSLALSLSLSHRHTDTQTQRHTSSHSLTHTHTLSLSHTHTRCPPVTLHPFGTCPLQTFGHAGTNLGRAAGRDLVFAVGALYKVTPVILHGIASPDSPSARTSRPCPTPRAGHLI